MDLFIIRHAWAGQHGDPHYADDALRPLTDKGRSRFRRMAKRLARCGFRPEVIATSPMLRCVETAEIAAAALAERAEVVALDDLLPDGDLDKLIAWTEQLPEEVRQAAWVGHAPDVDRLCGDLLGASASSFRFAKGMVAALRFDGPVARGEAQLRWAVTAKILEC